MVRIEMNEDYTCGDCIYYTGEECDCGDFEGCEKYDDSDICDEFELIEK